MPADVDLVLWPEDVIDTPERFDESDEARQVATLAREHSVTLVVGVVEGAGKPRFRNAVHAFGPDGSFVDRYDKVHRVPFGEYVPARPLFRHLTDLSGVPRDAIAGRGPGILRTPVGNLGVAISFEVFFASRARAATRAGGQVLLVPTNASSYKGRAVPGQELAAAQLRAWETGRDVVQSAPTGCSAFVSRSGRVRAKSDLGQPAVLQRPVELWVGLTPYARLGDRPITLLSLGTVVIPAWRRRTRRVH